ncbi:DUF58 domain-containing protein [Lacipirellula parvula]|uniref:DUF58 domain-containing protein n=1 Tax=Lacipirellula parvula TaxID=2650471 RepID=A0A5K7XE65_9BACT|nr:DUF58 domain-containing protein [Lacipirellula parvula]BBO34685.1 hypothetical protein PLANPX_4297 [Lacipirellula parvula]
MTIRPAPRLLGGIFAAAALAPLAFAWPPILGVICGLWLLLAVLALLEYRNLKPMLAGVSVQRRLPANAARGLPFVCETTVANSGSLPIHAVVREGVPPAALQGPAFVPLELAAGARKTITARLTIPVRGQHSFGPAWVRIRGPWKLLEAQQGFDLSGGIKVLPETYASRETLSQDQRARLMQLDKLTRTRRHGAGSEFESLAEYRPGDDPRRIDWRTTARVRRPVIRRYQVERHRDVMIVIDSGRLMGASVGNGTKLDCAVDAALMLARVALQTGDRCGIAVFDDAVRGYLSPVAGVSAMGPLADQVYALDSQMREADFGAMFAELQVRQPRRSLIVVLSDLVDEETSQRMRTSMMRLAKRHVVLFAALQTPLLAAALRGEVNSLLDGARKGVALRLLRQRRRALHSLRRAGVHILDVAPSDLSIPLINQFIELRSQDLL